MTCERYLEKLGQNKNDATLVDKLKKRATLTCNRKFTEAYSGVSMSEADPSMEVTGDGAAMNNDIPAMKEVAKEVQELPRQG